MIASLEKDPKLMAKKDNTTIGKTTPKGCSWIDSIVFLEAAGVPQKT